jgi:hypothetical protein
VGEGVDLLPGDGFLFGHGGGGRVGKYEGGEMLI